MTYFLTWHRCLPAFISCVTKTHLAWRVREDGESSRSAEGSSVLIPFPESCVWLWAHSHHYSSASHVYDTGESNIIQKSISNVPLILSAVLGKCSHIRETGSGYFLRPLFSHCPLWSVGPSAPRSQAFSMVTVLPPCSLCGRPACPGPRPHASPTLGLHGVFNMDVDLRNY